MEKAKLYLYTNCNTISYIGIEKAGKSGKWKVSSTKILSYERKHSTTETALNKIDKKEKRKRMSDKDKMAKRETYNQLEDVDKRILAVKKELLLIAIKERKNK